MMSVVDRNTLSVSEAVKEALIRKAWFPPGRIHVLYTGIDIDAFAKVKRGDFRKEINVTSDAILIGAVGRLSEEKGMDILVDAMPRILSEFPSLTLLIAGVGPLKNLLERRARDQGVGAHIHFLGYRNDIERLLRDIDLLVMPSKTEGFPLVLLEAMASGVPVVASNVGGIPEIVSDRNEGILVPPGDSMLLVDPVIEILKNSALREDMGIKAMKKVSQHFPLEKMLLELNDIYRAHS